jgi:hypothetical protein
MLVVLLSVLSIGTTPDSCIEKFGKELNAIERILPQNRTLQLYAILARACDLVPEDLRLAAKAAAKTNAKERRRILAEAARPHLPKSCAVIDPEKSATAIAEACPMPEDLRGTPALLEDLDQGTYAFMLVLESRFGDEKIRRDAGLRLLSNIALATALSRSKAQSKR